MKTLHEWIAKGSISSEIAKKSGFTELVRCKNCRNSTQLDDSNYFVCGKPFASNRETHTADWFCADGIVKDTNVSNKV